jgi:hypothetical protein
LGKLELESLAQPSVDVLTRKLVRKGPSRARTLKLGQQEPNAQREQGWPQQDA